MVYINSSITLGKYKKEHDVNISTPFPKTLSLLKRAFNADLQALSELNKKKTDSLFNSEMALSSQNEIYEKTDNNLINKIKRKYYRPKYIEKLKKAKAAKGSFKCEVQKWVTSETPNGEKSQRIRIAAELRTAEKLKESTLDFRAFKGLEVQQSDLPPYQVLKKLEHVKEIILSNGNKVEVAALRSLKDHSGNLTGKTPGVSGDLIINKMREAQNITQHLSGALEVAEQSIKNLGRTIQKKTANPITTVTNANGLVANKPIADYPADSVIVASPIHDRLANKRQIATNILDLKKYWEEFQQGKSSTKLPEVDAK